MADTGKTDFSGVSYFAKLGIVALGVVVVASKFTNPPPPKPPPVTPTPKDTDFDATDEKLLIRNAMLQMSREMDAVGWTDAARVYESQALSAPPGTAMRALQRVADELEALGKLQNVDKLRRLAAKIAPPAPPPKI